ncbi:MAG: hypothetical protein ACQEWG_06080 [Bacteroidota bacterium]
MELIVNSYYCKKIETPTHVNVLPLMFPTSNEVIKTFLFINECLEKNYQGVDKVILDFQSRSFCKPPIFVALACLIERIKLRNPNIVVEFQGGNKGFNNHLNNIKFKRYWEPGFNRDEFTNAENRTTLCLWHISQPMIENYGEQAKRYFKRNFLNDKDLQPLSSNLKEIFNNIFDHSKSDIQGYVLTQYYPKLKKLSFCICDFGVGISASVNKYLKDNNLKGLDDGDAILKSLVLGFSIRSNPRNRGFGLNNVKDFSDSSGGRLLIISNSGLIIKEHNKDFEKYDFPNFNGTLISVEIDSEGFDEYDIEEEIFEL